MPAPASATAAILIIGNEILSGKVDDVNTPFLTKELRKLGTSVERIIVIPDEVDTIAHWARELSDTYTWLFTSGGIGPTHDDVTIEAIAKGLGRRVERRPELQALIEQWFAGAPTPEAMKMADAVEGTHFHRHESFKYPVMQVENIFIFPGLPQLMRKHFAAVREMFRTDAFHLRIFYLRMYESDLASTLNAWLIEYPEIDCGSYPVVDNEEWHVRVTVESKDRSYLDAASASLQARLDPAAIFAIE